MKELDEARNLLLATICEICGRTKENECDLSEGGCVELQDSADQILNLKGDGWKIAIIHDPLPDERLEGSRLVKVIWEAGEG